MASGVLLTRIVAMLFAAFGYLPALAGAFLQELIDLAAILNALRVLRVDGATARRQMPPDEAVKLKEEHQRLMPVIEHVAWLAERVDQLPLEALQSEVATVSAGLRDRILPHEMHDDAALYPQLARMVGGEDPMASMSNTHREIFRLGRVIERLADAISRNEKADDSRLELRRTLYALDAILRMHFSQEEEIYHGLTS